MSEFVTARELAAILRKSTRTIYRMTSDDAIPFLRVGREYLYDPKAVVERLSSPPTAWERPKRSTSRKRVA